MQHDTQSNLEFGITGDDPAQPSAGLRGEAVFQPSSTFIHEIQHTKQQNERQTVALPADATPQGTPPPKPPLDIARFYPTPTPAVAPSPDDTTNETAKGKRRVSVLVPTLRRLVLYMAIACLPFLVYGALIPPSGNVSIVIAETSQKNAFVLYIPQPVYVGTLLAILVVCLYLLLTKSLNVAYGILTALIVLGSLALLYGLAISFYTIVAYTSLAVVPVLIAPVILLLTLQNVRSQVGLARIK